MLKHFLEQRLQTLESEFEAGQTMMAELEAKQANLRETLLRMSGAIQVLQECLQEADEAGKAIAPDVADVPIEPEINGKADDIALAK